MTTVTPKSCKLTDDRNRKFCFATKQKCGNLHQSPTRQFNGIYIHMSLAA